LYGDTPLPAPHTADSPASARIRFGTWEEFARFLSQEPDERGLFLSGHNPPPIGTDVTVQLLLPDGNQVLLEARVAYALGTLEAEAVGSDPGMGVQFTHMSEEQGLRLQQLIADAVDAQRGGTEAGGRDPRLDPLVALIERSQFDRAVRQLERMHNERPGRIDVRVLLHLAQARRARAQFEFDLAMEHYRALLQLDPAHSEARDQLELLRGEAQRTKALFERVFGRR
jgi:hypothetical protein